MDDQPAPPDGPLVDIPLIDIGGGGSAVLADHEPGRFQDIIENGLSHYGPLALRIGDRLSRAWLERGGNPYRDEIAAVAEAAGRPGAYLLNMSYEWTCTSGAGPDPAGPGCRLLRTLDWPLTGLGRNLVVARRTGSAGDYLDITWPGFVGVVTAVAPGRFAAAINQPPMRRWTRSCWADWAINRVRVGRRRALPPPHLLRRVFDEARDFDEARAMLSETPIAVPVFFTLAGLEPDQACVIERQEDQAASHDGPSAISNHWLAFTTAGRARGIDSQDRLAVMRQVRDRAQGNFDWVRPPILNPTTRLACEANAATGLLRLVGLEADGRATQTFEMPAAAAVS